VIEGAAMTDKGSRFQLSHWLDALSYITEGHRGRFRNCLILGLLSNGFVSAANPLALKYLFDEGIIRHDFGRFAMISIASVVVFTLWRVGVFFYRIYVQNLKNAVFSGLSLGMLNKFYHLPYPEILRCGQGYFVSRIYDEVATAAPLVMETALTMSNMLITLIVALGVAVGISFRATLMVFIAVPVLHVLSQRYGGRIRRESVAEIEEEAKVRGILNRAVGSYKMARIFDLQDQVNSKVGDQIGRFITAFLTRFKTAARYEALSGIFMSYVENIAIVSAGYEILVGRMSFGGFMGFMSAFWAVIGAVRGVFGLVPELSRSTGMVERLREFDGLEVDLSRVRYADDVDLKDVGFAYEGHPVFSGFNLALRRGERLLVVGPNGSGKSTLAHLVSGLLQPTTGVTATFPLARISAVILPFDFIPGTARENVGFAGEEGKERLQRLSAGLGVLESMEKDPAELSAGQRKRLEILMVLTKPADLYIIDEPLAGIDVESKGKIMRAILESTEGKTLLVIMHGDSEYYRHFDRVLDLATPVSGTPAEAGDSRAVLATVSNG
jgi:ABC-type multidrug transport system fused ATPase/permease subunit